MTGENLADIVRACPTLESLKVIGYVIDVNYNLRAPRKGILKALKVLEVLMSYYDKEDVEYVSTQLILLLTSGARALEELRVTGRSTSFSKAFLRKLTNLPGLQTLTMLDLSITMTQLGKEDAMHCLTTLPALRKLGMSSLGEPQIDRCSNPVWDRDCVGQFILFINSSLCNTCLSLYYENNKTC